VQQPLALDTSGLTDETFWQRAEAHIDTALKDYAAYTEDGDNYRRRLFADDAARGFAFIDLCRKRYDLVVMNPPFGAASTRSRAEIERCYPRTKNDIYATFVERGIALLHPGGMLGAITSRTGFFLTSFQKWREEILLQEAQPTVFADLGYGVLDAAMVETAAYVLDRRM
jgi:type I restriction-modification system DNA methylase subunit